MNKKDPVLIAMCAVFGVLFVGLMIAITLNTVYVVGHWNDERHEAASTTEELSSDEIPSDLKEQIETGLVPQGETPVEPARVDEDVTTEEWTGEFDPPEDIEHIRDDLPASERERLDRGEFYVPMDGD